MYKGINKTFFSEFFQQTFSESSKTEENGDVSLNS